MQDLIDYYVNLLIIQYHNKPNARATIDAIIKRIVASGIYFDVRDAYDIDTAVGIQLDILGKYQNIDRFYFTYELDGDYFGFANAVDIGGVSDNIVGFDDAASPDKDGLFLSSGDVISKEIRLNDESYRSIIKLRIIQNYSTHDTQSISSSVFSFFGDQIIMKDNYDMTITYLVDKSASEILRAAIQKDVLPRPSGVNAQVIDGNEFFGFADAENIGSISGYIVGFNDASAGLTKSGGFLNANSDIL